MLNGPVAAAKELQRRISINTPPRKLNDVLIDMIELGNALSRTEAADKAGEWYQRFESRARHELAEAEEDGGFLRYGFNSANSDYVQGSCFIEGSDSEGIKSEKLARAKQESYLAFFERLDANRFEKLCGKIIELLKVEEAVVSRASADQGVDFFGKLPFGTLINPLEIAPGAEKQLTVWLVGQAKHYLKTSVSTKDIRELVGSVILARSNVFAGKSDPLGDLALRVCDPIVFLFLTTGRFTRDSKSLLKRSGVVAMDGVQISVFLADHLAGQDNGDLRIEALNAWIDT